MLEEQMWTIWLPIPPSTHNLPLISMYSCIHPCRIPPLGHWRGHLHWREGFQGGSKTEVEMNPDSSPCSKYNQNGSWEGLAKRQKLIKRQKTRTPVINKKKENLQWGISIWNLKRFIRVPTIVIEISQFWAFLRVRRKLKKAPKCIHQFIHLSTYPHIHIFIHLSLYICIVQ